MQEKKSGLLYTLTTGHLLLTPTPNTTYQFAYKGFNIELNFKDLGEEQKIMTASLSFLPLTQALPIFRYLAGQFYPAEEITCLIPRPNDPVPAEHDIGLRTGENPLPLIKGLTHGELDSLVATYTGPYITLEKEVLTKNPLPTGFHIELPTHQTPLKMMLELNTYHLTHEIRGSTGTLLNYAQTLDTILDTTPAPSMTDEAIEHLEFHLETL